MKIKNCAWLFAVVFLCVCTSGAAQGQTPSPSVRPLFAHWQQVCKARIVLYGTLATRPETLSAKNDPLLLELHSVHVLKGPLPPQEGTVKAWYFLPLRSPEIALRRVQDLFNKSVVVFVGSTGLHTDEVAVMGSLNEAIIAAQPEDVEAIRAEVHNQAAILAWFSTSPLAKPSKPDAWDKKVKQGLDRLVRDATPAKTGETPVPDAQKRQQSMVEQMEQWGTEAVPALVRQLGDRRDLPGLLVGFTSSPTSWESKYYSHPEKVVDAIDSLLFVLTRAEVTSETITNGGTEAQRASVTRAWQIYLFYTHFSHAMPQFRVGLYQRRFLKSRGSRSDAIARIFPKRLSFHRPR